MSLDAADVLLRRAEGAPAVHVAAAAGQLLEHLAAIEGTTLPDQGILAVLARAGAQLLVSGIELDGACDAAQRLRGPGLRGVVVAAWRRFSRSYVSRARLAAAQAGSPSAVGSDGRCPYRNYLMEVLADPGPGDAEACSEGFGAWPWQAWRRFRGLVRRSA